MKAKKKAVALLLTLCMCLSYSSITMAAESGDAVTSSGSGTLTITDGSNGTLLEDEEQLATVTLKNTGSQDMVIHEYNLGTMSDVTVAAGESVTISAPDIYNADGDAYKLALTVDGTEVPLEGDITGQDITVSIVYGILDYYESHGQTTPRWITCAVYADENGVEPEYSVLPMAEGVESGDAEISNVTITSKNDMTAALRVGGTGSLTVDGATIDLIGDGGDDFTGIGSALGAADQGTMTVTNATVYTQGVIRSAIFAGDQATLNISDSSIDCEPGEYQSDVSIDSAGMASPPNGLGIWGNCRAMNLVDDATINIDNSEITSQNWGALGVDDVTDGHLTVTDSQITIKEQGYGSYSIGKCVDVFDNCTFDIAYGVVGYAAAGDGSEIYLEDGSIGNSLEYYGFVTHQSFNGTNSKIVVTGEGTELNTKLGGIIAKGRGADIEISDGAVVTAESGVLVRAQINDDTGAGTMDGTEVVNVLVQDTELSGDIVQGMGAPYEESGDASGEASSDEPTTTESGEATMGPGGDTSAITKSTMNVTLDAATLSGNISSATLTLAISDGNISMDNITDVGVVSDTVYESNENAVLNVTLSNGAVWTPTDTSYLMSLNVEDGTINGYVYVDGKEVTPENGASYTGDIVVSAQPIDTSGSNYVLLICILVAVVALGTLGGFFLGRKAVAKKE